MRRGRCIVAIAAIWFAQAATASADTLCVPSNAIPGCPKNVGLSEPTIGDATTNAHNGDVILIAADSVNGGPYKESPSDMGKSFTFIGAGPTKTIIQAQGTPGMSISSGSKVLNLRIQVYPEKWQHRACSWAGLATQVAIAAPDRRDLRHRRRSARRHIPPRDGVPAHQRQRPQRRRRGWSAPGPSRRLDDLRRRSSGGRFVRL